MSATRKVAMVTGAGSGIGRQTTLALLASGYSVILAGRHIETLEQTLADGVAHKCHIRRHSRNQIARALFAEKFLIHPGQMIEQVFSQCIFHLV